MKIIISLFLLLTPLLLSAAHVKVGVLAKRGHKITLKRWQATADYLGREIPEHTFEIVPLDFEDIFIEVQKGSIDFILANSGFYVELEYKYGAQRIATLMNKHISGMTNDRFGGVIFTHIDNREKYNTIKDLIGTKFGAVNEKSLGGWQMAWREMLEGGIDIKSDLESVSFEGTHDRVVYNVLDKKLDIGTVRTDTIERMAIEGKIDMMNIHFINIKQYDDFPFMISTRLYPEWPIAKLKHTSTELSKKVAIALMNMPSSDKAAIDSKINGWNTPLSYQPVHDCFKVLEIPPYYQKITIVDVIKKYWFWILFYLAGGIAGISMLIYQIRITRQLKDTQSELIQTEKMASLGRLVAGIAHEINTPIGVGVTAASHLHKETKRFNQEYENENVTQSGFESFIATSLQSSSMILDNLERAANLIRSFKQISVDQTSDESRDFNLKEYVQSIIESLKPAYKNTTHVINLLCDDNLTIVSNPGVFSQIFSNLIMNSLIHGFENKENGLIIITIKKVNNELHIVYQDNGKGMNQEDLSKLYDPFFTTKRGSGGSGLGANIIYNLVTQKLHGTISAESKENEGLTFSMKFKEIEYV